MVFEWLLKSFKANDYQGSSATYFLLRNLSNFGWSAAYPETTGYIIETLYAFDDFMHLPENSAYLPDYQLLINKYKPLSGNNIQTEAALWIAGLQFPNGALPGGRDGRSESAFNTGMMLFGLVAVYRREGRTEMLETAIRAAHWLCSIIDEDGDFVAGAYLPNYTPSYYTRILWGMAEVNVHAKDENIEKAIKRALIFFRARMLPNHAIQYWAFSASEAAHTHTIAYTIRGFLETGHLLNDQNAIACAQFIADRLLEEYQQHERLAGAYDLDWQGDYTYICITGHAQISLCLHRLADLTGDTRYKTAAKQIFETIINTPTRSGGLYGSKPFWGNYMRYKKLNWAAKFYLDAFMLYLK